MYLYVNYIIYMHNDYANVLRWHDKKMAIVHFTLSMLNNFNISTISYSERGQTLNTVGNPYRNHRGNWIPWNTIPRSLKG